MAETLSPVESELDDHKTELRTWIDEVNNLTVPSSCKKVVDRFVHDCSNLITYIDQDDSPSSRDLCDYVDRKNSLEIQYNNLIEEHRVD